MAAVEEPHGADDRIAGLRLGRGWPRWPLTGGDAHAPAVDKETWGEVPFLFCWANQRCPTTWKSPALRSASPVLSRLGKASRPNTAWKPFSRDIIPTPFQLNLDFVAFRVQEKDAACLCMCLRSITERRREASSHLHTSAKLAKMSMQSRPASRPSCLTA